MVKPKKKKNTTFGYLILCILHIGTVPCFLGLNPWMWEKVLDSSHIMQCSFVKGFGCFHNKEKETINRVNSLVAGEKRMSNLLIWQCLNLYKIIIRFIDIYLFVVSTFLIFLQEAWSRRVPHWAKSTYSCSHVTHYNTLLDFPKFTMFFSFSFSFSFAGVISQHWYTSFSSSIWYPRIWNTNGRLDLWFYLVSYMHNLCRIINV